MRFKITGKEDSSFNLFPLITQFKYFYFKKVLFICFLMKTKSHYPKFYSRGHNPFKDYAVLKSTTTN